MADIHKCRIEARHKTLHPAEEDVPDAEVAVCFLVVQLYQSAIFHQGDFNLGGSGIDDHFFFQGAIHLQAPRGGANWHDAACDTSVLPVCECVSEITCS